MVQPDVELTPFEATSFPAEPGLECDIVMKGGITSGVVYPLAVCELAKVYRLRSVGGASAGAIAAAAAAAAEVGRSEGADAVRGGGFLGLSRFPDELMEKQQDGTSLLFHLFRPQPAARRIFGLLMAGLDGAAALPKPVTPRSAVPLVRRLLRSGARAFPIRALVGALPGLALMILAVLTLVSSSVLGVLASLVTLVIGVALALVGLAVGVVTGVLADLGGLSDIDFGISSGQGETEAETALTPWLYGRLQQLAGRSTGDPLTFADLAKHKIDLRVMTTNLSRNQPLAMPWDNNTYFFDPAHFRTLFPAAVVDQMCRPQPLPTGPLAKYQAEVLREHAKPLLPFPTADRLPILVATRMSLSFPLLISAVPLYAVDFALPAQRDYGRMIAQWRKANPEATPVRAAAALAKPTFDVNWFSDGGLAANLPVHFFDSPLPTRPTFAIDLAPFPRGRKRSTDERENLYFPAVNSGGLHRRTAYWEEKKPSARLLAFGLSLFNTARVWVDESQLTMPGYRDRIVTVYQDDDEGGLNLSMPEDVVRRLSERGRFAALRVKGRFVDSAPGVPAAGWDNHRWIRFRAATAGLSDWLAGFERGYPSPDAPTTSYDTMLTDAADQPSYKIEGGRRTAAEARVAGLRVEARRWGKKPADALTEGRPSPPPELRLTAGDWRTPDQS